VRAQIVRLHRGVGDVRGSDLAQLAALAVGAAAAVVDERAIGGAVAIAAIAAIQIVWSRRPIPPIKVVGFQQMALGFALVGATVVGTHLA
jgi:hypothetical protein